MSGARLAPKAWPIEVVQGDTWPVETFTLRVAGTPVTLTDADAAVRRTPAADPSLTLTATFTGGVATVGGNVVTIAPGEYVWSLRTVSTELGTRTIVGGTVKVLPPSGAPS